LQNYGILTCNFRYFYFTTIKYGVCHLTIFNFGQTIYEGLKTEQTSGEMKNRLRSMSKLHEGYFGIGGWDEECLWTLYALQDGVSRFYDKVKSPSRGTGTIS